MKRRRFLILMIAIIILLVIGLSVKKISAILVMMDISEANLFLKYQEVNIPFTEEQEEEIIQLLKEGYYLYKPIKFPSGGWDFGIVIKDNKGNIVDTIIFYKDDILLNNKRYKFFNLEKDRLFEIFNETLEKSRDID